MSRPNGETGETPSVAQLWTTYQHKHAHPHFLKDGGVSTQRSRESAWPGRRPAGGREGSLQRSNASPTGPVPCLFGCAGGAASLHTPQLEELHHSRSSRYQDPIEVASLPARRARARVRLGRPRAGLRPILGGTATPLLREPPATSMAHPPPPWRYSCLGVRRLLRHSFENRDFYFIPYR
jgi:hypothetical protein